MNRFIFSYDIKDTKKTGNTYRPQLFTFFLNHGINKLEGRVGSTVTFESNREFDYWYNEMKDKMGNDIWIELAQIQPRETTGFKHNYHNSKAQRENFDKEWEEAKQKKKEETDKKENDKKK